MGCSSDGRGFAWHIGRPELCPQHQTNHVWLCLPVILVESQEDQKFKVFLSFPLKGRGEERTGEERQCADLLLLELLLQTLELLLAPLHVLLQGLDLCLPGVHVRLDLLELFLQLFLLPRLPGGFILTVLYFLLELWGRAEEREVSACRGGSPSATGCPGRIWDVACFCSTRRCGAVMLGPGFWRFGNVLC